MPWSKLSDDFSDDMWSFSDRVFRLHVEAIVWSGRKLLDMRLPAGDLRRFARNAETVEEDAAELVEAGWWRREGETFVIVHHSKYQRSRAAVINQQAVNKENRAKAGKAPTSTRELAPARNASFDERFDDSSKEMVGFGTGEAFTEANHLQSARTREEEPPPAEAPTDEDPPGEHVYPGTGEVASGWPTAEPGQGRWLAHEAVSFPLTPYGSTLELTK